MLRHLCCGPMLRSRAAAPARGIFLRFHAASPYDTKMEYTTPECIILCVITSYFIAFLCFTSLCITLRADSCKTKECLALPSHAMQCHDTPFHAIPVHRTTLHHSIILYIHYFTSHRIIAHCMALHGITWQRIESRPQSQP